MNLSDSYQTVNTGSNRQFGLTFAIIFLLVFLYGVVFANSFNVWLLGTSVSLAALSYVWPVFFTPFNQLWFKLGILLAKVFTPLILGVIFFLVVMPIGLLVRCIGIDSLNLKRASRKSYWNTVDEEKDKSMSDQF